MIPTRCYWLLLLAANGLLFSFASSAEENDATQVDPNLVPLRIELPEPFSGSEPMDYWSPNLEMYDYRNRPPFYAPQGTKNVAAGKSLASSISPVHGELKQITDGDKHYKRTSLVELPKGLQWVQVDLEMEYTVYAILIWHFHERKNVYHDVIVQVSNDEEFKDKVITLYNNDHDNTAGLGNGKDKEYFDWHKGRLIDTKGVDGRYVRFYSQGNSRNDFNHYIEIEVYGLPKSSNTSCIEGETEDPVDPNLVLLIIESPEPSFSGEPVDYWSPNLEMYDFRERPPFYAPQGTKNVAAGKSLASSISPVHGELKQITDGDKHYRRTSLVELPKGLQWVQVDLEMEYTVYAILIWHFHERINVYHDVIVQISNDKEFKDKVITLYNNDHDNTAGLGTGKDKEYFDGHNGRLIDTKGVGGRYVRFYSQGNSRNDFNHYIEIEVYGLPKSSNTSCIEGETEGPVDSDLVPIIIKLPEPSFG